MDGAGSLQRGMSGLNYVVASNVVCPIQPSVLKSEEEFSLFSGK